MTQIELLPEGRVMDVGTVFCIGRNYREHAIEMGDSPEKRLIIFIKPATSVVPGESPIFIPEFTNELHHEVEMVVLLDDVPSNSPSSEAFKYIMGYGVGLDLTARDIQSMAKKRGEPWTVAKGFDGSAPVSRFKSSQSISLKPTAKLSLTVNETVRQESETGKMIFKPEEIISQLSRYFTIRRGDLLFTGTPEGVGALHNGDKIRAELTDIALFSTTVKTTEYATQT